MKRVYLFVPLIIFIALVVLFSKGLTLNSADTSSPLIVKSVPQFSLPSLESNDVLLGRADLIGEVSLINVWGTWCPSCRHEHPYLMKLAKQVPIIGIDYKDVRADALRWLQQLGNPYVVTVFDEKGTLGINLGVSGAPETYVIDRLGYVHYKHIGIVNERVWLERLKPVVDRLRRDQ